MLLSMRNKYRLKLSKTRVLNTITTFLLQLLLLLYVCVLCTLAKLAFPAYTPRAGARLTLEISTNDSTHNIIFDYSPRQSFYRTFVCYTHTYTY